MSIAPAAPLARAAATAAKQPAVLAALPRQHSPTNIGDVDHSTAEPRVMGILAGDSESGSAIGVASKAHWVAAKIFSH